MNKKEFIREVSDLLRKENTRKPISIPKQVFHISDNEGNSKEFSVKKTEKSVLYTRDDVATILDACISIIEDSLKRGEPISVHGFGTLGLVYRKPRTTKCVNTDHDILVEGRYIPRFHFGDRLRVCAKLYEMSLNEGRPYPFEPDVDDTGGDS